MTDRDLTGKFLKLVEPVLGKDQALSLLDTLWRLEELKDMSGLFSLARAKAES